MRIAVLFLTMALALPSFVGAQRVVLVSVDGLRPDLYLDPGAHGASLPAFESLMREGVYAEAVEGVFPTVTYPSHTSIVTGARPARHGVLSNYAFDPKGRFQDWYWQAEAIRVKSLWDAAPGLTAAIQWPATVGAAIEVNLPEFWIPESDLPWGSVMKNAATPEALALTGPLPDVQPEGEARDELAFAAAESALEKHRPQLLLLHVVDTDDQQHEHGREHREVAVAFERVDRGLARLRARVASLGLAGETLFVVTGDHGFIQTHTSIHLNSRLREEGLLELGPDGSVSTYRALAWPSGGSCALMLKDRGDDQARRRLEEVIGELLEGPLGGLVRRIERSELDRLEAMPEAVFALEAEEGFVFGTNREGPLMTSSSYFGHHGYLPTRPKMKTGFLMVGPRVRQGIEVPYMRQVDIAPTIAFWAGWDLSEADGLALQGLFEKPD